MSWRPFSYTDAPNAMAAWRPVTVAAAVCLASGCSFMFSEGPPDDHRALESFQCGESYAPPVVDTIAAGVLSLGAINAAATKEMRVAMARPIDQPTVRRDQNVAIGTSAAFAALAAAGAVYGYRAVGDCRRAQTTRLIEVARATALPPAYGIAPNGAAAPPWPPRLAPAAPAAAPPPVARDAPPTTPPSP
ncbi:MAG TPA: hypothetical protein VG319_12825 [Polyangia bacterium]|nr:hypothetical protein [Polyangia bacterium]